jgi:hypothetical protein
MHASMRVWVRACVEFGVVFEVEQKCQLKPHEAAMVGGRVLREQP